MPIPFDFTNLDEAMDALNRDAVNERSHVISLLGQTLQGVGIDDVLRYDTTTFESWYAVGGETGGSITTGAFTNTIDTLTATPFIAQPYVIDGAAFEVTSVSGAGGLARIGIYNSLYANGSYYPGSLVKDFGEKDVAAGTGAKATTGVALSLTPGMLYFAAELAGVAAPALRALTSAGAKIAMGVPVALGPTHQVGYTVASTYSSAAGLPSTFPSGATAKTSTSVAMFLRYSGPQTTTRSEIVYSPPRDGESHVRTRILTKAGSTKSGGIAYFTLTLGVRSGGSVSVIDTFDSRTGKISPGIPYAMSEKEIPLRKDDIIEVEVFQVGRPVADLSDFRIQTDTKFTG